MTLHVYENPPRNPGDQQGVDPLDIMGINVWVEDAPPDFTDADIRWNVQQWAEQGDKVAKRALELVPGYWFAYRSALDYPRVRVYLDE